MLGYEDRWNGSGEYYSHASMNSKELFIISFFQLILSFPPGIYSWVNETEFDSGFYWLSCLLYYLFIIIAFRKNLKKAFKILLWTSGAIVFIVAFIFIISFK